MGKEVISLYTTPLKTNATWYSDSNIRDTMKRVRNYRPSFTINVTEPVAGERGQSRACSHRLQHLVVVMPPALFLLVPHDLQPTTCR